MSQVKGRLLVEGDAPPTLERDLAVVGRPINRRDALEKVTGAAMYSSDMALPSMLHAKILRCPYAHARVRRIDITRAAALPGVEAILTKDNTRDWHTQWYMIAQPAFPETVAYAGQEVAVVAATTPEIARAAVDLIEVDYEVLPAVFTPKAAMKAGAPLVPVLDVEKPRDQNVLRSEYLQNRGDVTRGFNEAHVVMESHFTLPTQYHADIQTRCCIADWDGARLTVHESSQGVWNVKRELAKSLGLAEEQVRVVVKYMGGGFGSKAGAQRVIHYAAKLSMLTGRPVRLELTRPEEFVSHPRRYGAEATMRIGATSEGMLTAIDTEVLIDIGSGSMYKGTTSVLEQISELYRCPNLRIRLIAVYTNTVPTGPQRGVMDPIATFCMEAAMDDLAVRLGIDPLTIRRLNHIDVFQGFRNGGDDAQSLPYSSKHLDECLKAVAEAINWEQREATRARYSTNTKKRGIGIAAYCLSRGGFPPFSAKADVVLRGDGSVELQAGVVEIGAGQVTILPMIVAEELGIDSERVRIHYGDTDGTHYAPSSHASRITMEVGSATLQAASLARQKLFDRVAHLFQASPQDLAASGGRIYARGKETNAMDFCEACALIGEGEIRATGSRIANPADVVFRGFGAHAAEVEVDLETGEISVLRVVSSHDIGRPLNPKLVESQQYGGTIMGLGYGLLEESALDRKTGILLNCDLHQYRMPTALEVPDLAFDNIEGEDNFYPYSAKPIGEAPLIGVLPAVRNAVLHAIDVGIYKLPLTAAQVLGALEARNAR
jgi:CO/xanthine dehydrogenase Mo-binding subunit